MFKRVLNGVSLLYVIETVDEPPQNSGIDVILIARPVSLMWNRSTSGAKSRGEQEVNARETQSESNNSRHQSMNHEMSGPTESRLDYPAS
jgi:hypothetical protein